MAENNVTRGYGLLEKWLAVQRARVADRLIPPRSRSGRLLDIGCGAYPYFLTNTDFREKFGLEQCVTTQMKAGSVTIMGHDLHKVKRIPFRDNYFDVVTMLAVLEHIEPEKLTRSLAEVRRVLKPGGLYVLTTPARWTDRLLRQMSKLGLVSPDEINDHKDTYDHNKIVSVLAKAKFKETNITCGYFELFMNLWATATKEEKA
jgi:2-polyprenyl-3-methyl-5-hydroxy-6-metoxy-1,4-benzoquinol methylase